MIFPEILVIVDYDGYRYENISVKSWLRQTILSG